MNSGKTRDFLRTHLVGLLALFVALSGTAVAAGNGGRSGGDARATAAVGTKKLLKKVKKLNRRVAALEARSSYPPNGAAGGDLSGSYPNALIAPGAVGGSKLGTIVTRRESVSIPDAAWNSVTAVCGPGERIVSGGGYFAYPTAPPKRLLPLTQSTMSGNGWTVAANNALGPGAEGTLTVEAYCLQ